MKQKMQVVEAYKNTSKSKLIAVNCIEMGEI